MNYLRDPDKIYLASFEAINNEVNLSKFPKSLHNIILRLIHATAMPDIINNIIWDGDVLGNAIKNIKNDKPILVDANMILAGIKKSLLPAGLQLKCFLDADGVLDKNMRIMLRDHRLFPHRCLNPRRHGGPQSSDDNACVHMKVKKIIHGGNMVVQIIVHGTKILEFM